MAFPSNLNTCNPAEARDDGPPKAARHLRRVLDPDMQVDVEILDVNDEEARALLLSIDPLAELADHKAQLHERLMELTPPPSDDLAALWHQTRQTIDTALEAEPARQNPPEVGWDSQYLVLVKCGSEREQIELLDRFSREGLDCKALLS